MRSGQKGLDEIQRIRAAMEGGNPVIPEPLQQLIKVQAALLGEDGDAIIQDIQEEAEKAGKLPADIFKLIEGCRQDLGRRAALQELSNKMIRAREPERLVQVEAIREQVTRYNGAQASGDDAALKKTGLMLKEMVGKYTADVSKDEEDGLAPDTAQTWRIRCMRFCGRFHTSLTGSLRAAQPPQPHQLPQPLQPLNRQTGWPPSGWPSGLRPTPWRL
jgi:hypothetical protein